MARSWPRSRRDASIASTKVALCSGLYTAKTSDVRCAALILSRAHGRADSRSWEAGRLWGQYGVEGPVKYWCTTVKIFIKCFALKGRKCSKANPIYLSFLKVKNHGSISMFSVVMHLSLLRFSCSRLPTSQLLSTMQTS